MVLGAYLLMVPQEGGGGGFAYSKHGAYFFSRNWQICEIKVSYLF